MKLPEPWEYHDALVDRFLRSDDSVRLEMSQVGVDETESCPVVLEVFGVHRIEVDDKSSDSELMAAEHGTVLTLEHTENDLYVIIEWKLYSPRRTFTHAYRVHGERVRVSVG